MGKGGVWVARGMGWLGRGGMGCESKRGRGMTLCQGGVWFRQTPNATLGVGRRPENALVTERKGGKTLSNPVGFGSSGDKPL